jgi:hypothetical protein
MFAEELRLQLAHHGITDLGEVALREALEGRCETYTLIKLAPGRSLRHGLAGRSENTDIN